LLSSCPGCDEEAVKQVRDTDGMVLWVATGWLDPYPGNGVTEVAIDYCPFCGEYHREGES
jgi:hypothetical protein